jgi:hypothetical protein
MAIANKDIENLQALYAKRFGIEISKREAVEMGTRLLNLFRAVLKTAPNKESKELTQKKLCQQKEK